MILPPAKIGMVGGGQLGRMSAMAARRMGYGTIVLEPDRTAPASYVAEKYIAADYCTPEALEELAKSSDVVTLEFENIPASAMQHIEKIRPIHPHWSVLQTCQSREREKLFLKNSGFPHAPFRVVTNPQELAEAIAELGIPCVLKSSEFGYDGKGQIKIKAGDEPGEIWNSFGYPRGVVEGWIDFEAELSVICARNERDEISTFPIAENIHTNHILDFSIVPGRFSPKILSDAKELGISIARKLNVVGLIAVELFLTKQGSILVNELAPRPHNSGHYTIDACVTSQFEQHIRAVCGLPLGDTKLLTPVVMVNLLGDVWPANGTPDWGKIFSHPSAKLHLYDKAQARPGRKMGHFCVAGETVDAAYEEAKKIKSDLMSK